jgi:hypothetical protein
MSETSCVCHLDARGHYIVHGRDDVRCEMEDVGWMMSDER